MHRSPETWNTDTNQAVQLMYVCHLLVAADLPAEASCAICNCAVINDTWSKHFSIGLVHIECIDIFIYRYIFDRGILLFDELIMDWFLYTHFIFNTNKLHWKSLIPRKCILDNLTYPSGKSVSDRVYWYMETGLQHIGKHVKYLWFNNNIDIRAWISNCSCITLFDAIYHPFLE